MPVQIEPNRLQEIIQNGIQNRLQVKRLNQNQQALDFRKQQAAIKNPLLELASQQQAKDLELRQQKQAAVQQRHTETQTRLTNEQRLEISTALPQAMLEAGEYASTLPEGQRLKAFQQQFGPLINEAHRQGLAPPALVEAYRNAQDSHFEPRATQEKLKQIYETQGGGLVGVTDTGQARSIELPQGVALGEPAKAPSVSDISGLRKEFLGQTNQFAEINQAYGRVQAASHTPSAAGDVALIFGFMKLLDPGSVVREGEFATAEQAQGVPGQIRSLYNRILSGERLTPKVRNDFLGQAGSLYREALSQHQTTVGEFTRIAEAQNIDPGSVIVDRRTAQPRNQDPSHYSLEELLAEKARRAAR